MAVLDGFVFQLLFPTILNQIQRRVRIHGSRCIVRMLHAESSLNSIDKGLLAEARATAIVIAVSSDSEELASWAMVRDLVLFQELRLHLDRGFVITVAADIKVRVS